MDAVWSIILTFVCVAIGLLSERKKKTRTVKTTPAASRTPATSRFKPAAVQQPTPTLKVNMPLPLPQEGEHISLPAPTADDLETMRRKKLRDQALSRHYSFWRRAVANQTILNRNH